MPSMGSVALEKAPNGQCLLKPCRQDKGVLACGRNKRREVQDVQDEGRETRLQTE